MNLMGAGCVTSPFLAMASAPTSLYPVLRVQDPTITGEAVMLIPPVPGPGSSFSFWGEDGQRVSAALISLSAGPQTKADCKGGGWESFGFKNQGQCVRYIETGKDSR